MTLGRVLERVVVPLSGEPCRWSDTLPDRNQEWSGAVATTGRDVLKRWSVAALALALMACAGGPAREQTSTGEADLQRAAQSLFQVPGNGRWEVFRFPGKLVVPFEPVSRQGRAALRVRAERSVSVLRQRFEPGLPAVGALSFSWKVDALPEGADLKDAAVTDAPVRILLAFEGDRTRWSPRAHRLSELSRLLTGEPMPYATLTYVWSRDDPVEVVLNNPRTDRIRKLVVDSGSAQLGQWRDHQRDVRADFIRAFGEEPGPLVSVALMTDTDNTGTALRAWYGPLRLLAPSTSP